MNEVTELSFTQALEILRLPLDFTDKTVGTSVLRAKCSIISTTQTTAVRAMEESFKQQRFDRLPDLLKLIQEEEKNLPRVLTVV